jgi:hypothetical protein
VSPATAERPGATPPPSEEKLHCCFIPKDEQADFEAATSAADVVGKGCQKPAEYVIEDLEERDPYSAQTHACTEHVGEMLGHHGEGTWHEGDRERWEVRPV